MTEDFEDGDCELKDGYLEYQGMLELQRNMESKECPFVRFHKALSEYGQACRDFQRMTVHLNALEIETAREKMRLAEVKVLTLFNTFTEN